ncbi:hypothetical protein ACQKNC_11130 [Lysinibacillus sp. NPDC094177]|uniref:hypothetical protein n=1 Tax=Lysinibacillus sp. NPDC094177 TaxID=3390580 RepID=UPI003CFF6918
MLKLMELGWKKYHLSNYFIRIIICIVATILPIGHVPWGGKAESGLMFTEYIGQISILNILIKTILIIILAVILIRLKMDEYKNHYSPPIFNIMSIVYIIIQ